MGTRRKKLLPKNVRKSLEKHGGVRTKAQLRKQGKLERNDPELEVFTGKDKAEKAANEKIQKQVDEKKAKISRKAMAEHVVDVHMKVEKKSETEARKDLGTPKPNSVEKVLLERYKEENRKRFGIPHKTKSKGKK